VRLERRLVRQQPTQRAVPLLPTGLREVDAGAAHPLARLAPEWCDQFPSPGWLPLRSERERPSPPSPLAV
jgi:hypothetical protein